MDSNEYSAPDKGEQDLTPGDSAVRNTQNIPLGVSEAPKIPLNGADRLFGSKGISTANSNAFSNMMAAGGSASAKSQITKNLL